MRGAFREADRGVTACVRANPPILPFVRRHGAETSGRVHVARRKTVLVTPPLYAPLAALWTAACTLGGTLDNVPNRPAVEVTRTTPSGPRSTGRPECPANPPTDSCPLRTQYRCEIDTTNGCDVCSC